MKRLILTGIASFLVLIASAQISTAAYFDGYWSNWITVSSQIRGNYGGFIIYESANGPWEPFFSFSIDDFYILDSKTCKELYKEYTKYGEWYEYTGTVEYYICDNTPSIHASFKKNKGPYFVPPTLSNGRPTKKITSTATIKIKPYKKHPKVYNIWFDNVGFAIDLNNMYFK